jgi:hypothetical protein
MGPDTFSAPSLAEPTILSRQQLQLGSNKVASSAEGRQQPLTKKVSLVPLVKE